MAHSGDTDKYEDFGLNPLAQKAFSKSALTRQAKSAATAGEETARPSMSLGWLLRLFFGLVILAAGIFAVMTIADQRANSPKEETAAADTSADTQNVALQNPELKGIPSDSMQETRPVDEFAAAADSADKAAANWNEKPPRPIVEDEPVQPGPEPKLQPKEDKAVPATAAEGAVPAGPVQKYYAIAGSFSDMEHALETKARLKYRTRVMAKDGKYRLVADSIISAKPAQYLIDSLKRARPNVWLSKAQ